MKFVGTYNSKYADGTIAYGGYSKFIRLNEKFAFKIPDNLPTEGNYIQYIHLSYTQ